MFSSFRNSGETYTSRSTSCFPIMSQSDFTERRKEGAQQARRKPPPDDFSYKDNILWLDCNHFLRKFGIRLPHSIGRRVWFVKDCAGITGAIFTWFLVVWGECVFFTFVILPFYSWWWSALNGMFSLFCATMGVLAHLRAMFSDPVS